jgi:hypothetical protein
MLTQKSLGAWVMSAGQLLLFAVLVFCLFDILGLRSRGELWAPFSGYLIAIFCGVAMQFIGSAIPHMKFTPRV